MPLAAGDALGPYEIVAAIGAGGMGEVYRAKDPRLNRDVAIKVSAAQFSERFEREAKAIAALNHPNICQLYDVGSNYLVMEMVDGPTLAERIATEPRPLRSGWIEEAWNIACQIAGALESAHERGIIHRDLKPANIKIKPDGTVKILDFGLAKVDGALGAQGTETTLTAAATEVGVILGTASYMAPEQAQGKPVDKRADIWAFGVVLYEMLTGDRLFPGASTAEILAGVLSREPDWDRAPARFRRLLQRCLEKDPKRRLRDIGEARFMVEDPPPAGAGPGAGVPRAHTIPWIVAGVSAAVALAACLWALWGAQPEDHLVTRLSVDLGPEATRRDVLEPRISPDGTRLVFVARSPEGKLELAVRSLDRPQLTFLAGTENATSPFFSPDGQWIGFSADGQLKKVAAQGGAVVTLANAPAILGASWGDDQTIVFAPGIISPLMRVSAGGGKPQPLTKVGDKGDATHRWPQVLPGGRAVLFTSHKVVTGFDDAAIEAVETSTGKRKTVLQGGYFGRYVPAGSHGGYLLYVREGILFGVQFDPDSLSVQGSPSPVLDDLAGNSDSGAGQFDVAGNGTLIYRSGRGPARSWPILWMDSSGRTEPLVAEQGAYYTIRLSPDGNRLALTADHGDKGREIEVYDLQRGSLTRLTFTGEVNFFPVWSADAKYIAFESSSASGYGIGLVRADGSGTLQRLLEHAGLMHPSSFSPDGRWLAYHELNPQTAFDIWVAPFDASDPDHPKLGKPQPFLNTPFAERDPSFSPSGRWIAYTSTESGRPEVYVRPFPGPGGKWQVSSGGGGTGGTFWARNGREIYFRAPDNRIMVSEFREEGNSFVAGKPRVWADERVGGTVFGRDFSLAPDGKRFAIIPRRDAPVDAGSVHVTFMLNFRDELKRRLK